VFPGYPLANKMAGNVVDLCPVGALGDVDFLYSQRVWFMRKHANVCAGCSTGCSIEVEENQDRIYRLRPRENPHVNQWWMCDEGRYGFKYVHEENRVTQPRRRDGDAWVDVQWSDLPGQLDQQLKECGRAAGVISPFLTVEEAYLLCTYLRQIDPKALLTVGPIPTVGQDETFPNGFTIRAEKCPNRKGVEAVVSRMAGGLVPLDDFLSQLESEHSAAVWVTGSYPAEWIDESMADRLAVGELLIVQDLFSSPLWQRADYQLPSVSFAERQGSYVNHADRLQSFEWAIRPPAGSISEGQLCWRLLGRDGLYNARQVMEEIGREMAYFAPAIDPVPPVGVDLKVNQLADTEIGATV
jgi:NADH-quinone oxidoreductase subunit G